MNQGQIWVHFQNWAQYRKVDGYPVNFTAPRPSSEVGSAPADFADG